MDAKYWSGDDERDSLTARDRGESYDRIKGRAATAMARAGKCVDCGEPVGHCAKGCGCRACREAEVE